MTDGAIILDGMRFYSYHGAAPQEAIVGAWYRVTLEIHSNLSKAVLSDCLDDTVDYSAVASTVRKEMSVRSRLLEHVAGRIAASIMDRYPGITSLTVTVTKENPPVGCVCSGSSVRITAHK